MDSYKHFTITTIAERIWLIDWLIDLLIDFNSILTRQGLFYPQRLETRVDCTFIFTFLD